VGEGPEKTKIVKALAGKFGGAYSKERGVLMQGVGGGRTILASSQTEKVGAHRGEWS